MTILIVVEPGIDGTFRHVDALTRYLIEQKQAVHLAYSDQRNSPELTALIAWVEQHGGKTLNLKVGNAPTTGDVAALASLWKFAHETSPDVIHSHSSKAGVLARSLALGGIKSRQFYTPHAYYGLTPRPGLRNKFFNGIESFFGRVGHTFNISEDERAFAFDTLHLAPSQSLLIPIAVDVHSFLPATPESKLKARRELGLPEDATILGWMGRLSFQKDPETLYRTAQLLEQAGSKVHLFHVGRGEKEKEIESLMQELNVGGNMTRLPYLRPPGLFYEAIDGLVMTSRYEGCPTVALEALSSNLPLVLSQAPGTNWLARSGLSHCWTAPIGNAPAFAQAISQWFEDIPRERERNHRQFALDHFAPGQIYGRIFEAYRTA